MRTNSVNAVEDGGCRGNPSLFAPMADRPTVAGLFGIAAQGLDAVGAEAGSRAVRLRTGFRGRAMSGAFPGVSLAIIRSVSGVIICELMYPFSGPVFHPPPVTLRYNPPMENVRP